MKTASVKTNLSLLVWFSRGPDTTRAPVITDSNREVILISS